MDSLRGQTMTMVTNQEIYPLFSFLAVSLEAKLKIISVFWRCRQGSGSISLVALSQAPELWQGWPLLPVKPQGKVWQDAVTHAARETCTLPAALFIVAWCLGVLCVPQAAQVALMHIAGTAASTCVAEGFQSFCSTLGLLGWSQLLPHSAAGPKQSVLLRRDTEFSPVA